MWKKHTILGGEGEGGVRQGSKKKKASVGLFPCSATPLRVSQKNQQKSFLLPSQCARSRSDVKKINMLL